MRKSWNIIETVIATLLQAWALFYIYSLVDRLKVAGGVSMPANLWIKAFHINFLLGVLCFLGGIGLLYDKRWGWVSSIICTLAFAGFMLVSGRNGVTAQKNVHMMASVSYLIVAALFIALFILLVQKPFRIKYKPNFLTWLLIGGALVLVVIDKSVV